MKNTIILLILISFFSHTIAANKNIYLAPKQTDYQNLIAEYQTKHPLDFFAFIKNKNNVISKLIKTSCSLVMGIALVATTNITGAIASPKNVPDQLNISQIEKVQFTNIFQIFSSPHFSQLLQDFSSLDISDFNNINTQKVLKQMQSFNPQIEQDFKKILNLVVDYNKRFFDNYKDSLSSRTQRDKTLLKYMKDVEKGKKELIATSNISEWKIMLQDYSETDLTDRQVRKILRRHKQITERMSKNAFEDIYEKRNNSIDLWINNNLFLDINYKKHKLHITPYKIIAKNRYDFNNEQFYSLKIKSLNNLFFDPNIGGMNIKGINHIFIKNEVGDYATKQISDIFANKDQNVFFEGYDGEKIRQLDKLMRGLIRDRYQNKLDINQVASYIFNFIEAHELQHKVDKPFEKSVPIKDKYSELAEEEFKGYSAGTAHSEIPLFTRFQLIPNFFFTTSNPVYIGRINGIAKTFQRFIQSNPIDQISFSEKEIAQIANLQVDDESAIELAIKIVKYLNYFSDNDLNKNTHTVFEQHTGRKIHQDLKVISKDTSLTQIPSINKATHIAA